MEVRLRLDCAAKRVVTVNPTCLFPDWCQILSALVKPRAVCYIGSGPGAWWRRCLKCKSETGLVCLPAVCTRSNSETVLLSSYLW